MLTRLIPTPQLKMSHAGSLVNEPHFFAVASVLVTGLIPQRGRFSVSRASVPSTVHLVAHWFAHLEQSIQVQATLPYTEDGE
jgi:hypothetical protein